MRALPAVMLCSLARPALANECNAYSPLTSTADVPLGCPVLFAVPPSYLAGNPPYQPQVTTSRYDPVSGQMMTVDLTGAVTRDPDITLLVEEYHYDGTCELQDDGPQPQPYAELEVALAGAQVGDLLDVPTLGGQVHVIAAGPCPAFAAPQLECADPIQTCADAGVGSDPISPPGTQGHGGCTAGGSAGPGLALVLLACLRRRRA